MLRFFNQLIDKRIAVFQRDLIKTHYAEVENMYTDMRGWRHDFKHHLQVLKNLLEQEDTQAATQYLQKLEHDLSTTERLIKSGNKLTDAILSSKLSLAESKNINTSVDANVPVDLNIPEIELSIIIGNLFDNAIEACEKLPIDARSIRVYITMKNTQLYMSFTNTTTLDKQRKIGDVFRSTKGMGRGLGLLRIDAMVERVGGYLTRNSEDGSFTTEVLLPQN